VNVLDVAVWSSFAGFQNPVLIVHEKKALIHRTHCFNTVSLLSCRKINSADFWVVTPCGVVGRFQRMGSEPSSSGLKTDAVRSSETLASSNSQCHNRDIVIVMETSNFVRKVVRSWYYLYKGAQQNRVVLSHRSPERVSCNKFFQTITCWSTQRDSRDSHGGEDDDIAVLVVTPCRLIGGYQRFRETYRLHLQGWSWRQSDVWEELTVSISREMNNRPVGDRISETVLPHRREQPNTFVRRLQTETRRVRKMHLIKSVVA
jgi:hypothetical protein